MKDECVLNSSSQQPSAIQSSSPTPTLHPSSFSSLPLSHVPIVQFNDDGTSSATQGPTADASMPLTYDVSESNALFNDLRFCFPSQFVLTSISLLLTNRFPHRRVMKMIIIPNGQHLHLSHRLQQVHQSQLLLHHQRQIPPTLGVNHPKQIQPTFQLPY